MQRRKGLVAGTLMIAMVIAVAIGALVTKNRQLERSEAAQRDLNRRLARSDAAQHELLRNVSEAAGRFAESLPPGSKPTHEFYQKMVADYESALIRGGRADGNLEHQTAMMHYHLGLSHSERFEHPEAGIR